MRYNIVNKTFHSSQTSARTRLERKTLRALVDRHEKSDSIKSSLSKTRTRLDTLHAQELVVLKSLL
jgi:hypothetical protein